MITMSALSRLDEHEEELRKIGERMVRVEGRVEALEGGRPSHAVPNRLEAWARHDGAK